MREGRREGWWEEGGRRERKEEERKEKKEGRRTFWHHPKHYTHRLAQASERGRSVEQRPRGHCVDEQMVRP